MAVQALKPAAGKIPGGLLTSAAGERQMDMAHRRESERREELARLWSEAELAVQAYVCAAIRGFQDAEDVVQQVAVTAARRFDEYDPARPFVAWALWLAKARVIDFYRSQGRRRLVFSEVLLDQVAESLVRRQSGDAARAAALETCIGKLPEKSRRLMTMRYAEDASMEAIAAAIQSTAGAVRVMLFRIRGLLADCVRAELAKEMA
jgi:RNA polymerase sigma-70 factor (ECF subfamily)